jgi:hypothetical protein
MGKTLKINFRSVKKILFFNCFLVIFFFSAIAEDYVSYKAELKIDNIFTKGRDIDIKKEQLVKNEVLFYFINYSEENSFFEITLRTLLKNDKFFALKNKLELVSDSKLKLMNNLSIQNPTNIFTFFDKKNNRNYYYRIFDNKNLANERCIIFVTGTKKDNRNYFKQILNGVGCSTEIKVNHKNISKILTSIIISEDN